MVHLKTTIMDQRAVQAEQNMNTISNNKACRYKLIKLNSNGNLRLKGGQFPKPEISIPIYLNGFY